MPSQYDDEYPLSKSDRNDIYRKIEAGGMPVGEFDLEVMPAGSFNNSLPTAVIRHRATGSLFAIRQILGTIHYLSLKRPFWQEGLAYVTSGWLREEDIKYHPFFSSSRGSKKSPRRMPWRVVVNEIGKWTMKVADFEKYQAMPDLWGQLKRDKEFLGMQAGEKLNNTPFSPDEQKVISGSLEQIRDYITTTYELTSEQISNLDAKLDHAEEASKRLGRKDWFVLFNGAVFSLILTDTITPDTAQHIIMMAIHGLSHLFGMGGGPLQLPPG
jgi:hypothetical protein